MELISPLREAGGANKCVRCPDGGGNKDHKGKGGALGLGAALRRGHRGPGGRQHSIWGLNSVVHPSRSPHVSPTPLHFLQQAKPTSGPLLHLFALPVILLHRVKSLLQCHLLGEPWLDYPV